MRFILQFEAFFIQPYLFQSGKLKEMIGASRLLDTLVGRLEEDFVKPLFGSDHDLTFLRKAGGVFIAEAERKDVHDLFKTLWPLHVRNRAPGLQFGWATTTYGNDAQNGTLGEALIHLRHALDIQKNLPATPLPGIAPIAQRYQRTGEAALPKGLARASFSPDRSQPEPVSAAADAKRQAAQALMSDFRGLLPNEQLRFPTCFNAPGEEACKRKNAFPFKDGIKPEDGGHDIALIHADGNSIGGHIINLFRQLAQLGDDDQYRKHYRAFTVALGNATRLAVKDAIEHIVAHQGISEGPVPMRPLIVGGDDVTVIVRADLALAFTKKLLVSFSEHSESQLNTALPDKALRDIFPRRLTMTSGMSFIKSNQPFQLGYRLCESLTDMAKKKGRARAEADNQEDMPPAMIAFHQVTQSLFEEADHQLEADNRTHGGKMLGQTVWCVDDHLRHPSLTQLITLYRAFDQVGTDAERRTATFSFLRKLASTLHTDPHHAQRMWHRWLKNNAHQVPEPIKTESWLDQNPLPLADLLTLHRTETVIDLLD